MSIFKHILGNDDLHRSISQNILAISNDKNNMTMSSHDKTGDLRRKNKN